MISIWFIVNPNAGTERNKSIGDQVNNLFPSEIYEVSIKETSYPKHAIEIAQEAVSQKIDIVVAVGGDGSVNEAAQALINQYHTVLGIIPLGSGNGLARSLKIPIDIAGALEIIKNNKVVAIDTGMINGHMLMLSNMGVGFDTAVAKDFASNKKRGLMTYIKLVTQNIIKYKPKDWEVSIDGKTIKTPAFMLNIANANQFGYNFSIDPTGELTDGKFEMVVIKPFPLVLGAEIAIRGFTNTIHNSMYSELYAGKEFFFKNMNQNFFQIDGDFKTLDTDTISVKVLPKSLKVLIPA